MKDSKWISRGNILNIIFFAALLVMLFVPSAKAFMIRGLMTVGLFQPDIPAKAAAPEQTGDVLFSDDKGRTISLQSLKGKVIFINFWAAWCPPCQAELPAISKLYEKFSRSQNIVFLIADTDNQLGRSIPFVKKHRYSFPVVGLNSPVPQNMLSGVIPVTLVINKKGDIAFKHEGTANYNSSKFVNYLQALADE